MNHMPPLPGDMREIVLFGLQDIQERINKLEELLCLSEEEEENEDQTRIDFGIYVGIVGRNLRHRDTVGKRNRGL